MRETTETPCFKCGQPLERVFHDATNQPSEGTTFRTYGHYGSTFWDSFHGEEIFIQVCDQCLKAHTDRIMRQKRYKILTCNRIQVGRQYVEREPVLYFKGPEDIDDTEIEPEEINNLTGYGHIEWIDNAEDMKKYILDTYAEEDKEG